MDDVSRNLSTLLIRESQRVNRDLDRVVFANASRLRSFIIELSPVDMRNFRAAWQGPFKIADVFYELRNFREYGPVIELGGYRGVGPKTARREPEVLPGGVAINGGIFPTQRPHAPVRRGISMVITELMTSLGDMIEGK